jgi:hypothetical protein
MDLRSGFQTADRSGKATWLECRISRTLAARTFHAIDG